MRAVFLLAAAVTGCALVELAWRDGGAGIDEPFAVANVVLYTALLAVVYLAGQRTWGSVVGFLALCLAVGFALHFVVEFKGQVILPADIAAAGTALSVSQGYEYRMDERLWQCAGLFAAFSAALALLWPRKALTARARVGAAAGAVLLVGVLAAGFFTMPLDDTAGFEVDNWAPRSSYEEYGALLSFLALAQDARVPVPAGYSPERCREILAAYPDERDGWLEDSEGALHPTVIAVMNESFADLSNLAPAGAADDLAVPACEGLAEESLAGGTALASVFAGGTCNSEFEFLTGTSMAFQSGGYYPYLSQDFSRMPTLARYFTSIGYRTCALHPNWPANWRRDEVYPAMGFDEFVSAEAWEDAERVRGEVTDAAVYDEILRRLDGGKGPQFLFAITMANHGGYGREVEPAFQAEVGETALEGEPGVYADLVRLADADLADFVDTLRERDEPIVLCFFGDHQPSVADGLLAEATGATMDEAWASGDLATLERCYEVPYFIWENDAQRSARVESGTGGESPGAARERDFSSLCYLSAQLVAAAGLPQTPFMQLADATHGQCPLFNAIGYWDGGQWKPFSIRDSDPRALNDYAIASYGMLYGDEGG